MVKIYDFEEQRQRGEAGENRLDRFFAPHYAIRRASMAEQRRGIDRFFADRDTGEVTAVEYKTDSTGGRTNNAFVETVSVDTACKLGWAYTSRADVLIYWLPPLLTAYIIRFVALRSRLQGWRSTYPERRIPNRGYHTVGLLVPLCEFEDIAEAVVSP